MFTLGSWQYTVVVHASQISALLKSHNDTFKTACGLQDTKLHLDNFATIYKLRNMNMFARVGTTLPSMHNVFNHLRWLHA